MFGEFCLMRGMDEACLLSLAEAPGDACIIRLSVDQRTVAFYCPIDTLTTIDLGDTTHLAGPDGLCGIERDRSSIRFRFMGLDRRARAYEIEAARFDVAITMLSAGRRHSLASLK